jgi:hypothetical protein
MDLEFHGLAWAFTATNAVRALFYVPQVMALARSADARDIALSTWWMWLLNNALGALYAACNLHDIAMALSFAASLLGCATMIGTTLYKRSAAWRRGVRRPAAKRAAGQPAAPTLFLVQRR